MIAAANQERPPVHRTATGIRIGAAYVPPRPAPTEEELLVQSVLTGKRQHSRFVSAVKAMALRAWKWC